jgi:hypothetical protein
MPLDLGLRFSGNPRESLEFNRDGQHHIGHRIALAARHILPSELRASGYMEYSQIKPRNVLSKGRTLFHGQCFRVSIIILQSVHVRSHMIYPGPLKIFLAKFIAPIYENKSGNGSKPCGVK